MYAKLILIGNLGGDPEMKYTTDGKPVTTFSLATSRKYKDHDETTWFKVSVWGNQAESCNQYLHKGSKVLVEGRLRPDESGSPRVFQRKDGTWGSGFDMVAETVRFLTPKGERDDVDSSYSADVPF